MHNWDRTLMEFQPEDGEFMNDEFEGDGELVFNEEEIEQLAAELLAVSGEEELDHFFGKLVKKAGGALGKFVKSPMGRQLVGMLRGLAKKGLPIAGAALGNMIAPGIGGMIGGKLASAAGSAFGLELEGLSPEDEQFEIAKQFIRLAGDAAKTALSAPANANPLTIARDAMGRAVSRYAPGLAGTGPTSFRGQQSGRWVRRGNRIVLYGV